MSPIIIVGPVHFTQDAKPCILSSSTLNQVVVAFVILVQAMVKLPEFLENLLAVAFVHMMMAIHSVQDVAFGMKSVIVHDQLLRRFRIQSLVK